MLRNKKKHHCEITKKLQIRESFFLQSNLTLFQFVVVYISKKLN